MYLLTVCVSHDSDQVLHRCLVRSTAEIMCLMIILLLHAAIEVLVVKTRVSKR